ncbi:MAG: 2-oxoacid:ferredoxin oxidoreductase subunit beta [Desulfobacteraceae bacterium]|nr:MAG: 2-oxoacid:ferredoxin oxidoreductase subunit beta [Desulfobacteraceae bacterium]
MVTVQDFDCTYENKWCPGCGNFGILSSMKEAFAALDLPPEKLLLISGIGQAAKTPHFLRCNLLHSLHGRALPIATGAKMANHDLTIVVNSGDGDCYGEGGNHFMNAIRRNVDLTLLVHNNKVYGLTKGQASPTSDPGTVTKAQPHGVIAESFNPLAVALSLGAGFVARGFSGDGEQLTRLIQAGIRHKGFALIDIAQPCVSFNRVNTHAWYKKRVYDLETENHQTDDLQKALALSFQWGDRIPTGIFFRKETPTFTERLGIIQDGPIISRTHDPQKLQDLLSAR